MRVPENLKELYWSSPLLSDQQKEKLFFFLRGYFKGKHKDTKNQDDLKKYINNILEGQYLSNSFSICYPKGPKLKLYDKDPKLIAYYLPQYYPDKHNDIWWGKGTTEWTNVSKSVPQYIGQYQPRLPGELGFYDLRLQENIYRQIELAQNFGIYGFCFYFYWFNGERLLDLPFNKFVYDNNVHFPFSICWVNESWTRQWEGNSDVPLIKQDKSIESYCNFITSCTELFTHDNYITINGKPILTVYRPLNIPNPKIVLDFWRDYVFKKIKTELYIIASIGIPPKEYTIDYKKIGFDACSEFAPGPQLAMMKDITDSKKFVCKDFQGKVLDYKDFFDQRKYFMLKKDNTFRAVSPMWDNTARKKNKGLILDGATPDLYKKWLLDIIIETKNNSTIDAPFIFLNAWNEWAEGAYLEPDLKWKYGFLEATKEALIQSR